MSDERTTADLLKGARYNARQLWEIHLKDSPSQPHNRHLCGYCECFERLCDELDIVEQRLDR